MSSARYLEIDSRYRDRNQGKTMDGLDSSPANFVVEISQSGTKSISQAVDPLSAAAPKHSWNSSFDASTNAGATSITLGAVTAPAAGSFSDKTTFIAASGGATFRAEDNYYVGAPINLTGGASTPVVRRIESFERLSATTARIIVDRALPDGAFPTGGSISNPTTATNAASPAVPQLFIPLAPTINNFFANCLVHVLSSDGTITSEYRRIIAYDAITHLATLDSPTTTSWQDPNANFVIIADRATNSGVIPIADAGATTGGVSVSRRVVQLASTACTTDNIYTNSYLRLGQFDNTVAGFFPGAQPAPYGEQRLITSYTSLDGTFTAIAAAGNTFTLNTTSNVDLSGLLLTNSTQNETREVLTYNTTTKAGTVSANWGAGVLASDTFFVRSAVLSTAFSTALTAPGAGESPGTYEIEQITRDNAVPFNYTGSLVSSSQMICYEIELLNLILPNSTLVNGGRIAFYPYVYVMLENVSSAAGRSDGLIWSNNPNARKMLFRAVVDDTPTPLISPFVKIDGDGMVQTVKFKPNDSFRFAVFLPDGSLFQTVASDTTSPNPPNTLVQISAVFSIKKL